MPPALSDYDSDSEPDFSIFDTPIAASVASKDAQREEKASTPQANPTKKSQDVRSLPTTKRITPSAPKRTNQTIVSTAQKKRKSNKLLAGLDLRNIITVSDDEDPAAKDTPSTSSVPTSSWNTRARTNKMLFSKPVYDQKYHPMDDVLKPSRAAQHRARYEEQYPEEDSEDTDFREGKDDESDSEANTAQAFPNKRRKLSTAPPTSAQPTRRSSRQVNRDTLYDANVHPQDEEIDNMEIDSVQEELSSDEYVGRSQSEDETNALEVQETERIIDETASESSSSPPHSSPLSSIGLGSSPSNVPRLTSGSVQTNPSPIRTKRRSTKQTSPPFEIYEDTPANDRKRGASQTAVTVEYSHDDKENRDPNTNFEREDYGDEIDAGDQDTLGQFVDTMFDDLQADLPAEVDYDDESALFPLGTRMARNRDRDSVLGTSSPLRDLDRTALGDHGSSPSSTYRLRQRSPVGGFASFR